MSKLHARAGRPCHYLESPSPPRFLSTCRACEWLNTCPAAAGTGEVTVNPAEKRSQPFQGSPNHEPGANQPTPDPSQERNWPAGVAPLLGGAGGGLRGTMRAQNSGNSRPGGEGQGEGERSQTSPAETGSQPDFSPSTPPSHSSSD